MPVWLKTLRGRDRTAFPELGTTMVDMRWLKPAKPTGKTAAMFFYNETSTDLGGVRL
jgi:hypothetical protein